MFGNLYLRIDTTTTYLCSCRPLSLHTSAVYILHIFYSTIYFVVVQLYISLFRVHNFHPNYLKKSPIDEVSIPMWICQTSTINLYLTQNFSSRSLLSQISYKKCSCLREFFQSLTAIYINFCSHGNKVRMLYFGPIIVSQNGYDKLIYQSTLQTCGAVVFMDLWWYCVIQSARYNPEKYCFQ